MSLFFPSGDQSIGTSMSTSVLPVNIQDWFPFCQCRRCSRLSFKTLCWEDSLEEEMTTHSSILAWRIPWAEEPSGLLSARSQRIRHNLVMECTHTQKRIAIEIPSRNELPLRSQAQEGLLCKCSQATGSDVGTCHSRSFLSYRRPALHPNPRV